MELFKIWIITTIASFIVSLKYDVKFIKDLGNRGYVIDMHAFSYKNKSISFFNNHRLALIPVINLLQSIFDAYYYSSDFDKRFRNLLEESLIERMTDEEMEEYHKQNNFAYLLDIPRNRVNELEKYKSITFTDGTKVWYKDSEGKIEIKKILGKRNIFQKDEIITEIRRKLERKKEDEKVLSSYSYIFEGYESHDLGSKSKANHFTRKHKKREDN